MTTQQTLATSSPRPDKPSADHERMLPYYVKSQTLIDGAEAVRAAGPKMLPRFIKESEQEYEHRRKNAKFTNIFRDICENLGAKPFAKMCQIKDKGASPELKALAQDIDGRGNNLHVFLGATLFSAIAKSVDYIFVDYTKLPPGLTLAQEKALGARPYWVGLLAERVIAAHTAMIGGREEFVHVRVLEPTVEIEGFNEVAKERVRVYQRDKVETPATADVAATVAWSNPRWQLWEKRLKPNTTEYEWVVIEAGELRIPTIPLVPVITGRRRAGAWVFNPPLEAAAELQIEHYQQETNLKMAKDKTCFPILVGKGVGPPKGQDGKTPVAIEVGPGSVLYAPPYGEGKHGEWSYIEINATSLKFLADDLKETARELRELGRQPLTAQSGNLTVVTTAFAAQKGNSAVQAWALNLKDAAERAFQITCMWLEDTTSKAEVDIYTDFAVELGDGSSMQRVIDMRKNRDIAQETLWAEAVRRGELSADFDPTKEKDLLAKEGPDPLSQAELPGNVVPARRPAA